MEEGNSYIMVFWREESNLKVTIPVVMCLLVTIPWNPFVLLICLHHDPVKPRIRVLHRELHKPPLNQTPVDTFLWLEILLWDVLPVFGYLLSSVPVVQVSSLLRALYSAEIHGLDESPLSASPGSVTVNRIVWEMEVRNEGSCQY